MAANNNTISDSTLLGQDASQALDSTVSLNLSQPWKISGHEISSFVSVQHSQKQWMASSSCYHGIHPKKTAMK
jgi:hypothetical protein